MKASEYTILYKGGDDGADDLDDAVALASDVYDPAEEMPTIFDSAGKPVMTQAELADRIEKYRKSQLSGRVHPVTRKPRRG